MNSKHCRIILSICVLYLVVVSVLIFGYFNQSQNEKKFETMNLLRDHVSNIQNDLTVTIERIHSLRALIIGTNGELRSIEKVGGYIFEDSAVRNFLIAPGGVVEAVYPLSGNSVVMGLDLLSPSNKSYKDAILAKESGTIVLTGPYDLKQGGRAFSGRLAVNLDGPDNTDNFWGLVSITVDFPHVISKRGAFNQFAVNHDYILSKQNENGEYVSIYQSVDSEERDYIHQDFSIFNINLRLEVVPKTGWIDIKGLWMRILLALMSTVLLGFILYFILQAWERLVEKANRDALTGALNRAGGVREINRIIRNYEFQRGLFMLLDIDHFKNINDTLGHRMGDEVLRETSNILVALCRSGDIICRLGGDEFVVFLPFKSNQAFAEEKAAQILRNLERTATGDEGSISITASIGATFVEKQGKDFESLYKEADEALYRSKESGRNKVTFYSEQ